MAYEIPGQTVSFEAAADLSGNQFYGVKLTAAHTVNVAGNGEKIVGVLQNKPAAAGNAATVVLDGITKAVAGAAISVGDEVSLDANGKFVTAAIGDTVAGVAVDAASADGDVISVVLGAGVGDTVV